MSLGKQQTDLTGPQADMACILAVLYQGGLSGRPGLALAALCKRLDMRLSTLQRYLTGLQEEGWIAISGDHTTARQARLTPLGESMCQEWWGSGDGLSTSGSEAVGAAAYRTLGARAEGMADEDDLPDDAPNDFSPEPDPTGYTPYGLPPRRD